MERWLERITDEELARIDEYVEKAYQDDISDISESFEKCKPKKIRENSWVKKKRYRKKLMKKFLSVKPDMTPEECFPMEQTSNAIYLRPEASIDGRCYCLNHVNHLYMTPRGHIEQFRRRVEWWYDGSLYGIESKDHNLGKITNRRIRHEKIDMEDGEVLRYSTYKKKYAPKLIDVI